MSEFVSLFYSVHMSFLYLSFTLFICLSLCLSFTLLIFFFYSPKISEFLCLFFFSFTLQRSFFFFHSYYFRVCMSDVVAFRAAKSAMCIAPVRKGKGHLTVVSQFKQNKMYITTLQQFQTKAQDATPFMVISLHNDLLQVFM